MCNSLFQKIRCQRKEPCRLFTVKKKADVEEVNTSTLCQCPHGHHCPRHHFDPSVIFSPSSFKEDHIKTYSGYCAFDMNQLDQQEQKKNCCERDYKTKKCDNFAGSDDNGQETVINNCKFFFILIFTQNNTKPQIIKAQQHIVGSTTYFQHNGNNLAKIQQNSEQV